MNAQDHKLIAATLAKLDGQGLPYPEDGGRTHWEGCWAHRGHHNCAVTEIERLRAIEDTKTGDKA